MPTNKKLRTPIIKPRTQGGTFYTFGSAMEDIGLNINERTNIVELSHYVLLDLPHFDASSGSSDWTLDTITDFKATDVSTYAGNYTFAEAFENYVLNMETVLRNQPEYNYAANRTVSERAFWKFVFKNKTLDADFTKKDKYYYEKDAETAIAKGFGRIYSGSQRSDDFGLYNETFVQIPSSYGQMRVLFQKKYDENYKLKANNAKYYTTNGGVLENVADDEYDTSIESMPLNATGISAKGIFDGGTDSSAYYVGDDTKADFFEAVIDLPTLRTIYGNSETLTYDDLGFGNVEQLDAQELKNFDFNAVLVYYSIYDTTGKNCLATNAYGVYVLNNAVEEEDGTYYFPTLHKEKSSASTDGTSFSFRLNIKPTSAYSGDVTVYDNSSAAFSMAEDFNDVLRNLNAMIVTLQSNATVMRKISDDDREIKQLAIDAMDKVHDLEQDLNDIKINGYMWANCDDLFAITPNTLINDEANAKILGGYYTNLRLSNGTFVSRCTATLSNDYVFLIDNQVITRNNKLQNCRTTRQYRVESPGVYSYISKKEVLTDF